jgi:hypothetical protein
VWLELVQAQYVPGVMSPYPTVLNVTTTKYSWVNNVVS